MERTQLIKRLKRILKLVESFEAEDHEKAADLLAKLVVVLTKGIVRSKD